MLIATYFTSNQSSGGMERETGRSQGKEVVVVVRAKARRQMYNFLLRFYFNEMIVRVRNTFTLRALI